MRIFAPFKIRDHIEVKIEDGFERRKAAEQGIKELTIITGYIFHAGKTFMAKLCCQKPSRRAII